MDWRRVTEALVVAASLAGCCFGGTVPPGGIDPSAVAVNAEPTLRFGPGDVALPSFTGMAGGPVAAPSFGPGCVGFVPLAPSARLDVTGPMPALSLEVSSVVDTTLVVRLPDGSVRCVDDSPGSLAPLLELRDAPAGRYEVFVGTFESGVSGAFTLQVGRSAVSPAVAPPPVPPLPVPPPPVPPPPVPPTAGVLQQGYATVVLVEGRVSEVAVGTICGYVQRRADPATGYGCRWEVECGGQVLFGTGQGGYAPCEDARWGAGVLVDDGGTTSVDGDASIRIDATELVLRDDIAGPHGVYRIVAERVGVPRPPRDTLPPTG